MNWINPLINDYHNWLKDNTLTKENPNSGWVTIQTPLTDYFNDNLEIYVKKEGDKITLSDDGATMNNLSHFGIKLNRGERKDIADKILFNLGIDLKDDELIVTCKHADFPQKKHNILSAMIELNQLVVMSEKNVINFFRDNVRSFLKKHNISFTPEFISRGSTGLEFTFDFQISTPSDEVVLKSFNTINKQYLSSFLFSWEDIKPVREKITQKAVHAVAILNDLNKPIAEEYLEALKVKHADYVLWSERNSPEFLSKIRA